MIHVRRFMLSTNFAMSVIARIAGGSVCCVVGKLKREEFEILKR
jgi:hypothetical protein